MGDVFVVDGDDAIFDEEVVADGGVFFDFFDEWREVGLEGSFFLFESFFVCPFYFIFSPKLKNIMMTLQ